MGDKDAIKQLQEKVKKALGWQTRVKEASESAMKEVEEQERQKRA